MTRIEGSPGDRKGSAALLASGLLAVVGGLALSLQAPAGLPSWPGPGELSEALLPARLSASLALWLTGVALLILARWSVRPPQAPPGRLGYAGFLLALATVLLAFGSLYSRELEQDLRLEAYADLQAIADLKAGQLSAWRQERLGDANILFHNGTLGALAREALERPGPRQALERWLGNYTDFYHYDALFLFDPQGRVRLSIPAGSEPGAEALAPQASEALRSGQVRLADFYLDGSLPGVRLALLVPLRDPDPRHPPLAVLALRIDPYRDLYPFLARWSSPTRTAETVLVQREGDQALLLSPVQANPQAPLRERFPLGETERLAVQAALGRTGPSEGLDLRGRSSLGVIRPVAGSPWRLLARVGTGELQARWAAQMQVLAAFEFLLLVLAGSGLALLWRSRQGWFDRRQAEMSEALAAAATGLAGREQQLRLALASANLGLVELDLEGGTALVNPEYPALLGYDPSGFRATVEGWEERLHPEERERCTSHLRDYLAGRVGEFDLEFRQRTGTGTWKWLLARGKVSARAADGQPQRMLVVLADITALKQAELRAERLAHLYAALSQCNQAIARCRTEAELFPQVCEAAVTHSGVSLAWIARLEEETGRISAVASCGEGWEYVANLPLTLDPSSPLGQGPTALALRGDEPFWYEEHRHEPAFASWLERGERYGWNSAAALPLRLGGKPVGALVLYSTTAEVFDEDGRRLLLEMAANISFALDLFAREARREEAEARLVESEERHRTLFADTTVPMLLIDPADGRILDANSAASSFYGWEVEELRALGIADLNLLPPEQIREKLTRAAQREENRFLFRHRLRSGEVRDVEAYASRITLNGRPRLLSTIVDVTARESAEAALRTSLHEKEALLLEVHHRVKNNLQVVSSLLRLESRRSSQPEVKTVLGEMQNRVHSMALLHEILYRSGNLAHVDLGTYLGRLANHLFRSMAPPAGRVELVQELAPLRIGLDQAVPCGLVVNELLSNSLKHGFPEGRAGEVRVRLQPMPGETRILLEVSDTGAGLPADFEERSAGALGLQLVRDLARQLQGRLEIAPGPGARFRLVFTPSLVDLEPGGADPVDRGAGAPSGPLEGPRDRGN